MGEWFDRLVWGLVILVMRFGIWMVMIGFAVSAVVCFLAWRESRRP